MPDVISLGQELQSGAGTYTQLQGLGESLSVLCTLSGGHLPGTGSGEADATLYSTRLESKQSSSHICIRIPRAAVVLLSGTNHTQATVFTERSFIKWGEEKLKVAAF